MHTYFPRLELSLLFSMNEADGEQLSGVDIASMIGDTTDDSECSSRGFTGVDVCGPV